MPITLKLSRPQRPAAPAAGSGDGSSPLAASGDAAASSPSPALASPSRRRTVSFSQQQQQQQQRYEQSPSPATPFRTGAGADWSTAARDAAPSKRRGGPMPSASSSSSAPQPSPTSAPRRPRSPTPPSSAYMMALPLKGNRASASSASPIDASNLSQVLTHLITRYATLAGYAAIEPAALDFLQESMNVYVESVLLQSLESALLGGRTDPGIRDVLGGLSWREQEEDDEEEQEEEEEEEESGDSDGKENKHGDGLKQLPPLARYVSRLITWRHNVPDYYDERNPAPGVATADESAKWVKRTDVDAFLNTGADDADSDELLSRKTRYLEKIQRDEIPSHLPELPAVHTWRRSADVPPAGEAPASTTLSRLENRLVSSRLVQSSLRSLIGKLDGVGSGTGLASTGLPDGSGSGSGQDGTAADLPAGVTQASKVKEEATPSSSPTTATAPPLPRGAGSRSLSVRLRPQSVSSLSAFSAAPAAALDSPATGDGPATKRRRGLSEYDHALHLDFRGGGGGGGGGVGHAQGSLPASPLSLSLATPGSASHNNPFNFPMHHRRAGSLASPALSTPGAGGGYPWSNPLMSPVTPLSAGGAGGGRYFPAQTHDSGDAGTGTGVAMAMAMRRNSSALQSPSLSGGFAVGTAEGAGGETMSAAMTVLPPIVNFKAGWYAKKG